MKKCLKEGCSRSAKIRGYCRSHYTVEMRTGRLKKLPFVKVNGGPCKKEGCEKIAVSRGFCDKHYQEEMAKEHPCKIRNCEGWGRYRDGLCEKHHWRLVNLGSTDEPEYVNYGKTCSVEDCNRPANCLGLCKNHYEVQAIKKWKQKKRAVGLCTRCGAAPAEVDRTYCLICLKKYRTANKKRKNELAEKGLCGYCGQNKATIFYAHTYGKRKKSRKPMCDNCYFRRAAYNATGSETNASKLRDLWEAQGGKCFYTGKKLVLGENTSVDHIISRRRGGSDNIDNLCWASWYANQAKKDLSCEDFLDLCYQVVEHSERRKLDSNEPTKFSAWVEQMRNLSESEEVLP